MKYTAFLFLLLFSNFIIAQENDTQPGEWVTVNLDMTDSMTIANLGYDIQSKLASKVLNIVTRNGKHSKISCVRNKEANPSKIDLGGLNTGILCKPKLEIYEEDIIDTGMEKLNVVRVSLSIFVQSAQGNVIYASITKDYQGSGKNKKAALNNAIVNIKVKNKKFEDFLKEARSEVVRYYNQMCDNILEQANTLTEFKQHTEAIFLLWPIPYEVDCHKEAREKMITIYRALVEYSCKNLLFDARTYITSKDYGKAMAVLRKIDAEASCASEALVLMTEISAKVDEQEKLYIDLYKKMRENEFELEKERYKNIGDMTKSVNLTKIEIEKK